MSLRPEATACVCRAYIEHGMHTLPGNVKLYYIGPDVPPRAAAKGTLSPVLSDRRGSSWPIGRARHRRRSSGNAGGVLRARRADENTLYVNSIGCKECRPKYVELLREELRKVEDQLGADSQRRIETNPLRVLDSKVARRAADHRKAAAHLRSSLRRLPRAFREAERRTQVARHRL